jgi:hypothetical protein
METKIDVSKHQIYDHICNMPSQVADKFKAANAFWRGLKKIGLTPAAVLRQSRLPVSL